MILVDLYLPDLAQGLNLLQGLKANPLYKSLPTLVLSWSNNTDDVVQVFNHAADGYLIKPTDVNGWSAVLSLIDKYWHKKP